MFQILFGKILQILFGDTVIRVVFFPFVVIFQVYDFSLYIRAMHRALISGKILQSVRNHLRDTSDVAVSSDSFESFVGDGKRIDEIFDVHGVSARLVQE